MQRQRKKKPSDYPVFSFRLPDERTKRKLIAMIEEIYSAKNASLKEDDYKIGRNQIVLEALTAGLQKIKRGSSE